MLLLRPALSWRIPIRQISQGRLMSSSQEGTHSLASKRKSRRNFEFTNNLTWTHNRHTFKGGFVIHQYNWTSPLNFTGADDFGVFRFDNNLAGGAQGGATGNPVANFLLGIPSSVDQTATGPGVDGSAYHYGGFFQDEWRVNNDITLSLGIRYEVHPGFKDNELNITNFLRDTPNGDAVVPNEASLKLAKPTF